MTMAKTYIFSKEIQNTDIIVFFETPETVTEKNFGESLVGFTALQIEDKVGHLSGTLNRFTNIFTVGAGSDTLVKISSGNVWGIL